MPRATSRRASRLTLEELHRLLRDDPAQALRRLRALDGRLTTDATNRLVYRVESAGADGPRTLAVDGRWRLTPQHDLALDLRGRARTARQTLSLKGALLAPQANALVVELQQAEAATLAGTRRLSLSGRWAADARNRLLFLVERSDGTEDRLTFQGGWELNGRQQVVYRYRRSATGSRAAEHRLVFDGAWDLTKAHRLVYRLAGSPDSAFEFRASLRSPSLVAREGRIVYDVGVGFSRGRSPQHRVVLFGAWKLHRDLSVSFEMPVARGRVQVMRFEGTAALGPRHQVAVTLSAPRGERLGLTVVFARALLPDAELFLRLKQDAGERAVFGGVRVRF